MLHAFDKSDIRNPLPLGELSPDQDLGLGPGRDLGRGQDLDHGQDQGLDPDPEAMAGLFLRSPLLDIKVLKFSGIW